MGTDYGTAIKFENDNGQALMWVLNGTTLVGSANLGNPGPSWHIKASGDF